MAHLAALFWFPAGLRRASRGTRICETPLLAGKQHYLAYPRMQTIADAGENERVLAG